MTSAAQLGACCNAPGLVREQGGWRKSALAPVIGSVLVFAWFYPIISAAPLAGPDSFAVWTWMESWR